ncbi:M20 family peptidase [Tepidicaulis sp. LMO-SS28]|uniref:M20 family peptidase n=1 Tax=Tepidicaulis sp. LMO-SS28 TaxID=3447455 RepID=UPI003EE02EE4
MKKILAGLGVLLIALIAVVLIRTFMAGAPEAAETASLPRMVDIDETAAAARLGEALQFRTISNQLPQEGDDAPFVEFRTWLEETYPAFHGATEREIINGASLLFTWQGSDASLDPVLLMSHIDVVPVMPGTEGAWEKPPFSGTVSDGFIWGRGAIDNKGSLIAMVEAAEHLAAQGFQPKRTLMFAFGHDEEIGGPEGNKVIGQMLKERGVRLHWVADEGGIIADGLMPGIDGKVALIGVAEKGYVSLSLTAHGKGGHSSMPPKQTAVGKLAEAIDKLQKHPFPGGIEGPAKQMIDSLTPHSPFLQRMAFANQWLFGSYIESQMSKSPASDAQMRTTIAPTMLRAGVKENVLPTSATGIVNFRIHPRDDFESVTAHVKEAVGEGVDVEIYNEGRLPSSVSPTDSDGFKLLSETIRATFPGAAVAPNLVVGGTDARHYSEVSDNIYRFIPVVLGPDDTARFHGTNERITVENMGQMVRFYVQFIEAGTAGE